MASNRLAFKLRAVGRSLQKGDHGRAQSYLNEVLQIIDDGHTNWSTHRFRNIRKLVIDARNAIAARNALDASLVIRSALEELDGLERAAARHVASYDLVEQLQAARLHAKAEDMARAQIHIDNALRRIDKGNAVWRTGRSVRIVRGYIARVGFAITNNNVQEAVKTLDEALRELE